MEVMVIEVPLRSEARGATRVGVGPGESDQDEQHVDSVDHCPDPFLSRRAAVRVAAGTVLGQERQVV
jgi:hypothetical protein